MDRPGAKHRPARRVVLGVSLLLGLTACGRRGTDTTAFTVKDSVGVSIAVNAPTVEPPAWTLGGTPLVVLGDEATGDAPLFRVSQVRLGEDGRVVVAHAANEIRAYAADGAPLWVAGRAGKGPGEFGFLSSISLLPADTVAALDAGLERLTLFDADGSFVSSTPWTYRHIKPEGNMVYVPRLAPLGVTDAHRTFALVRMVLFMRGAPGRRMMNGVLSVFEPDGQAGDSLASIPIAPSWEAPGSERTLESIEFAPVLAPYVVGDRLYAARGEQWSVDVFDTGGRRLRSIRETRARVPVTQAMVDALPPLPEGVVRSSHVPDSLPAIGQVLSDRGGRVWAIAYRPDEADSTSTRIYDAEGRLVGVVAIPAGFRPMDVRDGRVAGVQKDAMGVETVAVYAVTQSGG